MVYDAVTRLVGLHASGLAKVRQTYYSVEHIHFIDVDAENGSVECDLLYLASRLTPKINLHTAIVINTQKAPSSS